MQSERSFLRWLTAVLFVILAFASAASAQAPDLADASDLTPPINVADVPSAQTQDATPSAPTSENPTEAASEFPASPIAAPATPQPEGKLSRQSVCSCRPRHLLAAGLHQSSFAHGRRPHWIFCRQSSLCLHQPGSIRRCPRPGRCLALGSQSPAAEGRAPRLDGSLDRRRSRHHRPLQFVFLQHLAGSLSACHQHALSSFRNGWRRGLYPHRQRIELY